MKLVYPEIDHVFDTRCGKVPSLVIENQALMYRLLCDLRAQLLGKEGKCVVSLGGRVLPTEKSVELLSEFVPFTLNKKALVNRASVILERSVMEGEFYGEAVELAGLVESFLLKASAGLTGDVFFSRVGFSDLLKASGLEFREDYASLGEKLLDYMELVSEYEGEKLFVLYNLRCLISDREAELFLDSVLRHGYNALILDGCEHARLSGEQRYLVDEDLCEIC